MTKEELARALDQLDPGSTLRMDEVDLAKMFGAGSMSDKVAQAVEAFAVEHRCSFTCHEKDRIAPCFEKDDVF